MLEQPMYAHRDFRRAEITDTDLSLEENALRVHVRTKEAALPVLRRIEKWMAESGYPRIDRFSVTLALQEAIANAIHHGNRCDPNKTVQIRFAVRPKEVVVEVQDEGPGFDPDTVPNPLLMKNRDQHRGWGLFMMRTYTTWMAIEAPGNRVSFGRHRSS